MNIPALGRRTLALTVLLSATLALNGCKFGSSNTSNPGTGPNPATARLAAFATADDLASYLKDGMRRSTSAVSDYSQVAIRDWVMMAGAPSAAPAPGAAGSAPTNLSTTNVQETGVDEADRIKSDGSHLFILHHTDYGNAAELRTLRLGRDPLPRADQLASLSLTGDVAPDGFYLFGASASLGARLVTLGSGGGYYFGGPPIGLGVALPRPGLMMPSRRDWFIPWSWQQGRTEMQVVDVADPAQPQVSTRIAVDGHLVDSRRIGDVLYLVTRFTPSLPGYQPYPWQDDQVAANEKLLAEAGVNDLLPHWYLDGEDRGPLVEPTHCYQPPLADARRTADLVTVTAIELNPGSVRPVSECITGGSEAIYVSTEGLYLATTRYEYHVTEGASGDAAFVSYDAPEVTTDLHKFALSAAGPRYRGSGSVTGHLGWEQDKKSFRMGEYDGVLRIATSVGESWDGTATTRLTLLKEGAGADGGAALVQVGQLPNQDHPEPIGKPGEQLYAARFVGNRGFLVTFRVTDPLYTLDLTDPGAPFVAGELHIDGYSDYLHPVNEGLLLGVGKDAVADSGAGGTDELSRGAWYQGVKVALFDISNPAAPLEINSLVIGKRGTQSAALSDHHAFTWMATPNAADGAIGRLALPIELHDRLYPDNSWSDPSQPWYYYDWTHTGLYLFNVGPSGVQEQGRIVVEDAGSIDQTWLPDSDRSLLRDDEVHYVRGGQVWSAPWALPTQVFGPQ